jgi:hypothetical protein
MSEFSCTKDEPYTGQEIELGDKWIHSDAVEISDNDCSRWMKCPYCGVEWKEILPSH